MKDFLDHVRRILLRFRYTRFISGRRPIKVIVHNDFLADKYAAGNSRMLKIGKKVCITTFEYMETTSGGDQIGHYFILYALQYVSFNTYCEIISTHDDKIEIYS